MSYLLYVSVGDSNAPSVANNWSVVNSGRTGWSGKGEREMRCNNSGADVVD